MCLHVIQRRKFIDNCYTHCCFLSQLNAVTTHIRHSATGRRHKSALPCRLSALQHVQTHLVFMRQWLDIRGEGHGIWFICSILINYATSYSFSSSQLLHFHLYCYHHLSSFGGRERFVEITELVSPDVAERKRGVKQRGPWRSTPKSCAKIEHGEVLDNTTYCLGPTATIRLESVDKGMKLSYTATKTVYTYWQATGTGHIMKGTWNKQRDACFGPAWHSSGVQFILADNTKVARHLCPLGQQICYRTNWALQYYSCYTDHALTAVWMGLCVCDTVSITYSTRYDYFVADMKPLNSILCAYVRKLLSVYLYFLPSVCGTCKWLP